MVLQPHCPISSVVIQLNTSPCPPENIFYGVDQVLLLLKIFCLATLFTTGHTHCIPGEAYMCLITASCETGPGTMHMCIPEICMWSSQILGFTDRCVFHNSIFSFFSKFPLYIGIMKQLKLPYQGWNHHP
jgi:hypothetical protein